MILYQHIDLLQSFDAFQIELLFAKSYREHGVYLFICVLTFYRCRKLPRALKDWQAFQDLKQTIDDFNESCPLLELMANKAMKQRHWDRIAGITGHTFDMESETFSLRNIMEAPLLKHKEDIEVGGCFVFSLFIV